MLKAILCVDSKNGIGKNNSLPWKIKSEMQHFINETKFKTIVMGRKTFESIGSNPLKNRKNIIFTNNVFLHSNDELLFTNDFDKIINLSKIEDVYIIGGSTIFKIFEDYIEEFTISKLAHDYKCDVFFSFSKKFFYLREIVSFEEFQVERWVRDQKILNGRKVSREIILKIKAELVSYNLDLKKNKLIIIQVGNDFASSIYVKNKIAMAEKIGIEAIHKVIESNITQDELVQIINDYNQDNFVSAILVQFPLPNHINSNIIAKTISPEKDIDCFNNKNLGSLFSSSAKEKNEILAPCTPAGVIEILKFYNVEIESKNVVIINRSNIVGKPLSILFLHENATVTICHTKTKNLKNICSSADILISATGSAMSIDDSFIKKNAICIDVGISRSNNKISGDFDFDSVKNKCSLITPVPFGIGPMTIAMLFNNFVKLIKRQNNF